MDLQIYNEETSQEHNLLPEGISLRPLIQIICIYALTFSISVNGQEQTSATAQYRSCDASTSTRWIISSEKENLDNIETLFINDTSSGSENIRLNLELEGKIRTYIPEGYNDEIYYVFRGAKGVFTRFIYYAFNDIDEYNYPFSEFTEYLDASVNIKPILIELSLGVPREKAKWALKETQDDLISAAENLVEGDLQDSYRILADQVKEVHDTFEDFRNETKYSGDKFDLTHADYSLESVYPKPYGEEVGFMNLPEEILQVISDYTIAPDSINVTSYQSRHVKIERIGGRLNRQAIIHELWHILQYELENNLKEYVEFRLPDDTTTNDFNTAFATQMKWFRENDRNKYPIFNEITSLILYGENPENEELLNVLNQIYGYRNLHNGDSSIITNVAYTKLHQAGDNSVVHETIKEISAETFRYIWNYCNYGEISDFPPYILDLFDFGRLVYAYEKIQEIQHANY